MPTSLQKLLPALGSILPDEVLLARFTAQRDQESFKELVRRHGPLVHRVCHRLAPQHADDAFQAVFLVLACRIRSIQNPESLSSWLFGVAGRVSRQITQSERRRRLRERLAHQRKAEGDETPPELRELAAILDLEVARLPRRLRDPIVLCMIQGATHVEASENLGESVRTIRRRLDRAKKVLQARLLGRGIAPALAATLIAELGTATSKVGSSELIRSTVLQAIQFLQGEQIRTPALEAAKGVMGSMTYYKFTGVITATAVVLVSFGLSSGQQEKSPPPTPVVEKTREPAGPPATYYQVEEISPGLPDTNTISTNRTPNFIVEAPNAQMGRVIAAEAEFYRKRIALEILGKELPDWSKPCKIRYQNSLLGSGGATTFQFARDAKQDSILGELEMSLQGNFQNTLVDALPHEIAHTILASHFRRPLPRWADEGIALQLESTENQFKHDEQLRRLLHEGRAYQFTSLIRRMSYPQAVMALYAEGHSLVRFLLQLPLPAESKSKYQQLLTFLEKGMALNTLESWNEAARQVYKFNSIDEIERAWLNWLKTKESVPSSDAKMKIYTPHRDEEGEVLERIPPLDIPIFVTPPPISSVTPRPAPTPTRPIQPKAPSPAPMPVK
jgi:RNA polymerase sigma factor (sigma-70 family)